jgi:hypothetical protein
MRVVQLVVTGEQRLIMPRGRKSLKALQTVALCIYVGTINATAAARSTSSNVAEQPWIEGELQMF